MWNSRCAGCGERGVDLCRRCRFQLIATRPVITAEGVVAATRFCGLGKDLVVGLKYRNRRQLAGHLAQQLGRSLDASQIDVITWTPTTHQHVRRRGYDQAELLARALAALWRKPCRRMLFRHRGPTQTGRTRLQRLQGPVFEARPSRRPLRILVVDDVVTTGATLLAARNALFAAGARSVVMAAVAATPDTVPDRSSRMSARKAAHPTPLGLHLAWASSIESSAPVKARS